MLEFASELRALPRGEIDLDALEAFLAFNSIPAPYSIFRDVRKLPAGHVLVWEERGGITIDRYARPGPVPAEELRGDDEAELVEELRARLRDSVRAHLLSDVPVGVLALRRRRLRGARRARGAGDAEAMHTFTIGFEERSFDERDDARRVAERYGDEPPRAARAARPLAAAAGARGGVRRAVRRLVGAADLSRLAARLGAREGRALRRGRRRAVRRLLHVRRRPARRPPRAARPDRAAARRAPADLDARRRASTTRRSASCERRTCRRSSATTAGRRSSRRTLRAELRGTRSAFDPRRRLPRRATPRPRAPTSSRVCRTSTSGSTSSTTCS